MKTVKTILKSDTDEVLELRSCVFVTFRYRVPNMSRDRAIPESKCYGCSSVINMAVNASGEIPESGDATVCGHCGVVCVFDADLHAVKPDEDMMKMLMIDPQICAVIASVKARPIK